MTSTCKHWNMERGFGFVRNPDGSKDIFVHHSELQDGARWLEEGDEVDFEIQHTPKGLAAVQVHLLSATPADIAQRNSRATITHPNPRYRGQFGNPQSAIRPALHSGLTATEGNPQ